MDSGPAPLAADLSQHLVDGLFDVCGGAAASGLALDGFAPPHLPAQLVEGLGHRAALVGAGRALEEGARHFGRQPLPLLRGDPADVVQVGLVAHQHQGHVLRLLDVFQEAPERSYLLKASPVCDVVDDEESVPPSHVTLLLLDVLLETKQDVSVRRVHVSCLRFSSV